MSPKPTPPCTGGDEESGQIKPEDVLAMRPQAPAVTEEYIRDRKSNRFIHSHIGLYDRHRTHYFACRSHFALSCQYWIKRKRSSAEAAASRVHLPPPPNTTFNTYNK